MQQRAERTQPLFWRLHMAPNKKIAMRDGDWKILANLELTEFELYNLQTDPKEENDLQTKETERFNTLKTKLIAHNSAVEAEGPDWWKRLSPNGGADPKKAGKKGKKAKE
jgi:arylsulfatase A